MILGGNFKILYLENGIEILYLDIITSLKGHETGHETEKSYED